MYDYVDKSTGRKRTFRKKEGRFVVRLAATPEIVPARRIAVIDDVDEQAELGLDVGLAARLAAPEHLDSYINVLADDEGSEVCVVPDEVAVQFRPGVAAAKVGEILREAGLRRARDYGGAGLIAAAGVSADSASAALERLNGLDEVELCGPLVWGLDNREQSEQAPANQEAFAEIGLPWSWGAFGTGSPETRMAIIDSGFDLDHPALRDCVEERPEGDDWDFATSDLSPGEDRSGHGTAVAGIAAGKDAASRFVGAAPSCRLVPLKVKLIQAEVLQRVAALRYLAANAERLGVRVVNCSWFVDTDDPFVRVALEAVADAGCLIVCSAGNKNQSRPHYPSDYDCVVSVAGLAHGGSKWEGSNYGPGVDLSAPAADLRCPRAGGGYLTASGTSLAAPMAGACAALLLSRNPGLTAAEVRQLLTAGAEPVDALNPGYEEQLGRGRVNAFQSLLQAAALG